MLRLGRKRVSRDDKPSRFAAPARIKIPEVQSWLRAPQAYSF